jgi:hypothetical protein
MSHTSSLGYYVRDYRWSPQEGRCRAMVLKRDTYRYTGRTKSGFELHYSEEQCSRCPGPSGYCWQHAHAKEASDA